MTAHLRIVLAGALALGPAVTPALKGGARPARPAARVVTVEPVQGDHGDATARATLRASLSKYLRAQGFTVGESPARPRYRLRPSVLRLEVAQGRAGVDVEVRASVVAVEGKRVVAIVEGGARARAATPAAGTAALTAQALDAAARKIAEDLGRRIGEAG